MKRIIRLNESDINRMVNESVRSIISELDWKTYANASKKRKEQGDWRKSDALMDYATDKFNDKYGISDSELDDNGNWRSSSFGMSNGYNGNKGGLEFTNIDRDEDGVIDHYVNRRYRSGLEDDMYDQLPSQGTWYYQHGIPDDEKDTKRPHSWSKDVQDKAEDGIRDVDRYYNGDSEYTSGIGWDD